MGSFLYPPGSGGAAGASSAIAQVVRGTIAQWRGVPNLAIAGAPNNGWVGIIVACPVPFSAVRVGVYSQNGAGATNVGVMYVQPIEDPTAAQPFVGTMSDTFGSRGSSGNQALTWNGAGADSPYPSPAGAATTFAIPAGPGGSQSAGLYYSDWYALPNGAYPSKIGGTTFDGFYYLGVILGAGAAGPAGFNPAQAGDLQAFLNSSTVKGSKSFHLVDTMTGPAGPSAFATWNINTRGSLGTYGQVPVISIDIMTGGRVLNVGCIGDSQLEGWDSGAGGNRPTSDILGGVHRATLSLSSPALPIVYNSMTMPGTNFDNWYQTYAPGLTNTAVTGSGILASNPGAGAILPTFRPDVCFLQWASCNDNSFAPSTPVLQDHYYKALQVASWCQRNGIIPVLCTLPPALGRYSLVNSYWMAPEGARNFFNTQLRNQAAANANFFLLDTDKIVSAGGSPATIIPAFAQSDGIHFTDAGNIAIANAAATILAKIKGTG